MPRCAGHTLRNGLALGMCLRCAALHPKATAKLGEPRPDALGVWHCSGFVPLAAAVGEGA